MFIPSARRIKQIAPPERPLPTAPTDEEIVKEQKRITEEYVNKQEKIDGNIRSNGA